MTSNAPPPIQSTSVPLIVFNRSHKIFLAFIGAAFLLLVGFRLHGFSISCWRDHIDHTPHSEVLLGKARDIRSDDFQVNIPCLMAQRAHKPAFPVINTNIGCGTNMLLICCAPVKHIAILGRPTVWGGFIDTDVGLSWYWWSRILGLIYVYFLLTMVLSRNNFWLSVLAGIGASLSPLFQFWAFTAFAEPAIYGATIVIAGACMLTAHSVRGLLVSATVLGWAGAALVLAIYPPAQVCVGYLVTFLLLGFVMDRRHELTVHQNPRAFAVGGATAAAIFLLLVGSFFFSAHDAIRLMSQTTYPGQRLECGGQFPVWRVAQGAFAGLLANVQDYGAHNHNWPEFSNICEVSAFVVFWPVIAMALIHAKWTGKVNPGTLTWLLLALVLIFFTFMTVGVTPALARYTLLGKVLGIRAPFGLGLTDFLLIVAFFSIPVTGERPGWRIALGIALPWAGVVFACGCLLRDNLYEITRWGILAVALVNLFLATMLVLRRPIVFFAGFVGFLAWSTLWFNPLVQGGSAYLEQNAVSQEIRRISKQHGARTTWVVFDSALLPYLPAALGVRGLNGLHYYPQEEIWQVVDPNKRYVAAYNQFASFLVKYDPTCPRVHSPRFACCILNAPLGDDVYRQLGVTHFLVPNKNPTSILDPPIAELYSALSAVWDNPAVMFQLPNPNLTQVDVHSFELNLQSGED